ncbi:MAG TPA: helix-turn-helix domain-containing protein [Clostridia bacterium]|nr:helix-turn-helix domain-containing protein [Clostridia bacterium]
MDILECLMKIGFTKHESMLYITLCKEGELTGYEASKISGIPRSNAYLALAGLVEKGGAYSIDSDAVRYMAVPATELVSNTRRQMEDVLKCIIENVPVKKPSTDPYITIAGRNHIINKMKNIINNAKERVYLSMSPAEISLVEKEISNAACRGLKVVVITSEPLKSEGVIFYLNNKQPGQIRLIADSSHVLTGEIGQNELPTCLYSGNKNLIELIKDSLTNEIKLIKIKNNE